VPGAAASVDVASTMCACPTPFTDTMVRRDRRRDRMDAVNAPLVLVAHGSRDEAAHTCVGEIADAVAAVLPDVPVRVGYVDVRAPTVADAVAGLERVGLDGAVVVPAFLAAGYHVRTDLPAQLAACGADPARFVVTPALGPDPLLARATRRRLAEAGWCYGDAVVLAAAGSSDPAALAQVRAATRMLATEVGRKVRVGFVATAAPRVDVVVAALRRAGERRIAVASWLLAPGVFHTRLASAGADVVAAPLGAHPDVVAAIVARYESAARTLDPAA
jgi:sirohydrochlorin ferrochelatase